MQAVLTGYFLAINIGSVISFTKMKLVLLAKLDCLLDLTSPLVVIKQIKFTSNID